MLVVGERQTAGDPHVLDGGHQLGLLGLRLSHPLVQQVRIGWLGARHVPILRRPPRQLSEAGAGRTGTQLEATEDRVRSSAVITCVVEYTIDPAKVDAFERFGRAWIALVNRHGGQHHGYFLPSEGASDRALALFSFPTFADYEAYRSRFGTDPDFIAADRIRDESGCVLRYDRSFTRPLLDDSP